MFTNNLKRFETFCQKTIYNYKLQHKYKVFDINCSNHNSPFSVHVEWSKQKAIGVSLAEMAVEELDRNLRQFYAEARNKEGENYSRATLLSLRNGIERPPHSFSNQMLDAKIKQLKQEVSQTKCLTPKLNSSSKKACKTPSTNQQ